MGNYARYFGSNDYKLNPQIYHDVYKNLFFTGMGKQIISALAPYSGNCFGLAATSALNFEGYLNLNKYFHNLPGSLADYGYNSILTNDEGKKYYSLQGNAEAINWVERMMVSQFSTALSKMEIYNSDLDKLITNLQEGVSFPILVNMEYYLGGHTVVIDNRYKPADASESLGEGWYEIPIYDPNVPNINKLGEDATNDYKYYSALLVNPEKDLWKYGVLNEEGKYIGWESMKAHTLVHDNIKFYQLGSELTASKLQIQSTYSTIFGTTAGSFSVKEDGESIITINDKELKYLKETYDYQPFFGENEKANTYCQLSVRSGEISFETGSGTTIIGDSKANKISVISSDANVEVSLNTSTQKMEIKSKEDAEVSIKLIENAANQDEILVNANVPKGKYFIISLEQGKIIAEGSENVLVTTEYADGSVEKVVCVEKKNISQNISQNNQSIKGTSVTGIAKQKTILKVNPTTKKIKYSRVKKKKQSFNLNISTNSNGRFICKKIKGSSKIKVSKNGKVSVSKKIKRGTYKVTIQISAFETSKYEALQKKFVLKIRIK